MKTEFILKENYVGDKMASNLGDEHVNIEICMLFEA